VGGANGLDAFATNACANTNLSPFGKGRMFHAAGLIEVNEGYLP